MLATSLSLRLYDMIKKKDDVFAMIRYWCRTGKFGLPKGETKTTLDKVRKHNEYNRTVKLPF